jgi:hypothetical protein
MAAIEQADTLVEADRAVPADEQPSGARLDRDMHDPAPEPRDPPLDRRRRGLKS